MNIDQLRYIVDLAKTNSMNETAKRLFISQPAISESVKRLEKELGCTVLQRSKKGIEFTEDGALVLECAQGMLEHYHHLLAALQEKAQEKQIAGTLYVGVGPAYCNDYLPKMIAKIKSRFPQIDVKVLEISAEEIFELLNQSKIHFGLFGVNQGLPIDVTAYDVADLEWRDMNVEEIVAVMASNHPLANCEQVTHEMLKPYKHTLYINQVEEIADDCAVYISNNTKVHMQFMLDEGTYCVMTRNMFRMSYDDKRLVARPITDAMPIKSKLLYRKSLLEEQPLLYQSFIEAVGDFLSEWYR